MAELAFEYLAAALETTRGTAITNPTHYAAIDGLLTPKTARYRPNESRGTLAEFYRSEITRKWAEWEGEGPLDNYLLPLWLNAVAKANATPSTPTDAVLTRLWEYTPTMTSDDIKTLTLWWGDPNVQIFRSAFGYVDELVISADASGEDGATMSLKGMAQFPSSVADPTLPSQLVAPLIIPGDSSIWLDTSSAIGTTELSARLVSCEFTIPNSMVPKYLAGGPASSRTYSRVGRKKRSMKAKYVFELVDTDEYDIFVAGTVCKTRVRLNGPLIESEGVGPTDFYHYVEVDCYGPLNELAWGDYEGANRTVEFTVTSEYDTTLGADWRIAVQNDRTTL